MALDQDDSAGFRRSAARLRRVLTVAACFVVVVLVAERLGYAGAYGPGPVDGRQLAVQAVLSLPAAMNLAGLWFLRVAVSAAADGEPFGRLMATAFRRVGALLAASSFTALFVVPSLARLMGEPVLRLIDADISTLVLSLIGCGMLFVGILVDRAAAAQRELEEFF
jgi:hypothetical protein